jgi:hypothetical protein
MRVTKILLVAGVLFGLFAASFVVAGTPTESEKELIDKFLKKRETKHVRRVTWVSANFSFNRINRDNDYNKFANYSSQHFSGTTIPWLGDGKTFGLNFGMMVGQKFGWSVGGEYWLKMGINESGSFTYTPPVGSPTVVTNLQSEVQVWGISTGLQYYLMNPPGKEQMLVKPSFRVGGSIGYYQASWDLWDTYQNFNLSTASPEPSNTTYKGSAPGFSLNLGLDYPLGFYDMALGADFGYLYLNFANVAWYNASDQEVVASWNGSDDGRVELNFSGPTGRIEVKKFIKL